jgi:hypothetical protein
MIPPRRADTAADPLLLTGLLGAAAMLKDLRTILAEIAEDGDGRLPDGESPDDEVVDVVLGLAALAGMMTGHLPEERDPSEVGDGGGAVRGPIDLPVRELLR